MCTNQHREGNELYNPRPGLCHPWSGALRTQGLRLASSDIFPVLPTPTCSYRRQVFFLKKATLCTLYPGLVFPTGSFSPAPAFVWQPVQAEPALL